MKQNVYSFSQWLAESKKINYGKLSSIYEDADADDSEKKSSKSEYKLDMELLSSKADEAAIPNGSKYLHPKVEIQGFGIMDDSDDKPDAKQRTVVVVVQPRTSYLNITKFSKENAPKNNNIVLADPKERNSKPADLSWTRVNSNLLSLDGKDLENYLQTLMETIYSSTASGDKIGIRVSNAVKEKVTQETTYSGLTPLNIKSTVKFNMSVAMYTSSGVEVNHYIFKIPVIDEVNLIDLVSPRSGRVFDLTTLDQNFISLGAESWYEDSNHGPVERTSIVNFKSNNGKIETRNILIKDYTEFTGSPNPPTSNRWIDLAHSDNIGACWVQINDASTNKRIGAGHLCDMKKHIDNPIKFNLKLLMSQTIREPLVPLKEGNMSKTIVEYSTETRQIKSDSMESMVKVVEKRGESYLLVGEFATTFDLDKAYVKNPGKYQQNMKNLLDNLTPMYVVTNIVGWTDPTGPKNNRIKYNQDLSEARAKFVEMTFA